jgi:fructose-1,6-bisphosphatase/inositol monophosphatase family enzyme/ADP-ribosylglycohydrolase
MAELEAALHTALQAAAAARTILLAECARPDGPRGEIGKCPADDEAERAIRHILCAAFPTWGYLGEETGASPAAHGEEHVWIVDPNDGTTSMQRGYRGHAIAIGVVRRGVPILGVVWAVDAPDDDGDLIIWAEGCGPIRRNGVELPPRIVPAQLGSEDVVGLSQGANRNPVGYLACVAPSRFISSPSIAYRLALVAAGEHAATVSLNYVHAWDTAAGHALLRAAGGVAVDEHGQQIVYPAQGVGSASRIFAGSRGVVEHLRRQAWDRAPRSGFGDAAPPSDVAPVRAQPGKLEHSPGVLARAHGCLLGQLAGDSLGALAEFESTDTIARRHRIIAGQPTDGSELAMMLARSIVAHGGFETEPVAAAYASWFHGWTHTDALEACAHTWCRPFDVDETTARALGAVTAEAVRSGKAAVQARLAANRESHSTGALMRVSPLGIWGVHRDPLEVAVAARADAELTHPHAVCQNAAAVFTVTLAATIRDGLDARQTYAFALDWLRTESAEPSVLAALEAARSAPPADYLNRWDPVLVALQNAFHQLLHAPSLEEGVVATVRSGGDTNTNAAICGALLGAAYGRAAVPGQWQNMTLSCRPMPDRAGTNQPRPAVLWPTDILVLAERFLAV